VRLLCTSRAGFGHFHPLVAVAQAARAAGHEVAFAMPASFAATVEGLGFRWFAAGLDDSSPAYARFIEERNRLPGRERAIFMRRGTAALLGPAMADDVFRVCETWRPDLFLRDAADYGGCVAAEVLGVPHAAHRAANQPKAATRAIIAEPLAALRAAHGLAPDPALRMLDRYLVLSPFPPALDASGEAAPPTLHTYRATPFDRSGDEDPPDWPLPLPDAPLVFATLGTAINMRTDLLRVFVEALRDERVNLVVTTGRNGDPDQFGPQPPHVRIERYIPQTLLFPRCDLVISHGGSNTVLAALTHGLPQVIVPITADQPQNAERCASAGVARMVHPADATAASIREAALDVLAEPRYRLAARRMRAEMAALPDLDGVVTLLERLAAEKQPLHAAASC